MHIPNAVPPPPTTREMHQRDGVLWYARAGAEQSLDTFLVIADLCQDLEFKVIGRVISEGGRSNVTNLGWCDEPYRVLSSVRVLLNTSENEGMPNMALQALAVGTPVVGLRNSGLEELKGDFPDGVCLFEKGENAAAGLLLTAVHEAHTHLEWDVPQLGAVYDIWAKLLGVEL